MQKILEVRWHGRGGQGAKTAAQLLAEAAMSDGKYIQAFPEYGPERAGAPMKSFTRISDEKIIIHCGVTNPSHVVVIDPTLLGAVNVTDGIGDDGVIIVNSEHPPSEVRKKIGFNKGKVFTVDATKIAMETFGKPIPNTPMLGALVAATGMISLDSLKEQIRAVFSKKLGEKAVESNIIAIDRAAKEVKSE